MEINREIYPSQGLEALEGKQIDDDYRLSNDWAAWPE
jgi:hypothetical protein